ncbi:unnamed protein product [Rhizophagus irregularis]|nr:unnamed protein product [Rhizophagus irregularis]
MMIFMNINRDYRNVESIEEFLSESPKLASPTISKRSSFFESTTSSQQQQTKIKRYCLNIAFTTPLPELGWHFGGVTFIFLIILPKFHPNAGKGRRCIVFFY